MVVSPSLLRSSVTGIQEDLIAEVKGYLQADCRPQKSLAKAVGISEKYLSQVLRKKAWPSPAIWDRLLYEARWWPKKG